MVSFVVVVVSSQILVDNKQQAGFLWGGGKEEGVYFICKMLKRDKRVYISIIYFMNVYACMVNW